MAERAGEGRRACCGVVGCAGALEGRDDDSAYLYMLDWFPFFHDALLSVRTCVTLRCIFHGVDAKQIINIVLTLIMSK